MDERMREAKRLPYGMDEAKEKGERSLYEWDIMKTFVIDS